MPVPDWADELKSKMFEAHSSTRLDASKLEVKDKTPVTVFSNLFGEWELRGDDVLVHLFPRAGEKDQWSDGRYVNRCRNCKTEVPMPKSVRELKPCIRCGHTGLVYIPGRREERQEHRFPPNMKDLILKAADAVWEGNVAIEFVQELVAFAVQFQGARTVPKLAELGGMLDRFFERVDDLLDKR
jgi:hypothetical protein